MPLQPDAGPTTPGAPAGVVAMVNGPRSMVVMWSPAPDERVPIAKYEVLDQNSMLRATVADAAIHMAVIPNLTVGTSYSFRVQATSTAGAVGPASPSSSAVTAADAPGAPGAVNAAAQPGKKALVTWGAAPDNFSPLLGYVITAVEGGVMKVAGPSQTSVTVDGLTQGSSYTFRVAAQNALGTGPTTNAAAAVVVADAPGAPTGVTGTARKGRSIDVVWTAPSSNGGSPITSYTVTAIATGGQTGGSQTVTGVSASIAMLTAGTEYTFSVTAANAIGTGPAGTSTTPVAAGDAPAAPTGVTAAAAAGKTALVSWTAPASNGYAITGFTVREAGNQIASMTAGAMATSLMTSALPPGHSYTFTVSATNALGEGPASGATSPPITPTCMNVLHTIAAVDSVTVQYGSLGDVAPDNSVFAYKEKSLPAFDYDLTGWMKFDLSEVPKTASVQSISLSLTAQSINQGGRPTLQLLYSANDGWARRNSPLAADIARTQAVSDPMVSPLPPPMPPIVHNFTINVGARNFGADVTDGFLTLGITSTSTAGQNLYFGSDPPDAQRPIITLTTCE